MDFTDVALTALQVVSPVLVAALTGAAAQLASSIRSKVDNGCARSSVTATGRGRAATTESAGIDTEVEDLDHVRAPQLR